LNVRPLAVMYHFESNIKSAMRDCEQIPPCSQGIANTY